jgi:hypothetical protein
MLAGFAMQAHGLGSGGIRHHVHVDQHVAVLFLFA